MDAKFASLPGALWRRIEPLLPKRAPSPRGGRPPIPDRVVMAGVVYRLRTGCQWKALPRQFSSGFVKAPKGGDLTGPNPTDRAKRGVKRHILTDGRGVPLAAEISGANVHDKWLVADTLDAVVLRGSRGPRRPEHLCLDKGYDYADVEVAVRTRRIRPHIRRRGERPLVGCVRGKARRWVVERTNSWHNRFRGLLMRWERTGTLYRGLLHLGCALIAFQQARSFA